MVELHTIYYEVNPKSYSGGPPQESYWINERIRARLPENKENEVITCLL